MSTLSPQSARERIEQLIQTGVTSRAGIARAAGLHANSLRDCLEPDWNPTAETLGKLETFFLAHDDRPVLATIEEIIDEARNGRMFVLVDDEDRENEGDLVIPAQMATPQAVNFMATHGRGLICLTMTKARCDALGLAPMSRNNRTRHATAFTTSIEAREGVTTGISAADRARTISVAIDSSKGADDIVNPGHVFPLVARGAAVVWQGPWLSAPRNLSGKPSLRITLSPSRSEVSVFAYLYSVDGLGIDQLITHKAYTLRDAMPYAARTIDIEMEATSWDIPAGRRLALVVDTTDPRYSDASGLGSVHVSSPASAPSQLRLPLR